MNKAKLISAVVLAVLVVVLIVQNTATVTTKFLFFSKEMPQAVLAIISALLGFAVGVLVSLNRMKKSKKV